MVRPRGRGRGGFTLVEVILSSGILVIGLVGVAAAVTTLSNLRRTYTETQAAITCARTRLEEVRAEDFTTLLTNYSTPAPFTVDVDGDGVSDLTPTLGAASAGSVHVETVTDVPAAALGKLLRATSTIRWRGVSGVREVRLVTMVSDRGA